MSLRYVDSMSYARILTIWIYNGDLLDLRRNDLGPFHAGTSCTKQNCILVFSCLRKSCKRETCAVLRVLPSTACGHEHGIPGLRSSLRAFNYVSSIFL